MTNRCLRCLQIIDIERKALGFSRCISCQPQWQYKGALNFGHKTGGAIQPMHPDAFKVHKRVTARKAKGTNGAAFQQGTCVINIKDA
jgi:hypothetical protein